MNALRPLAAFHIPKRQRDNWIRSFLPPHEPFFLQEERQVISLLQAGMLVYTRAEFHESFPGFSLSYGGIYQLWDVPRETYVWMANATQRLQIDGDLLQEILTDQVRLHRGQVYDESWLLRLHTEREVGDLNDEAWQNLLHPYQINDLTRHFILTHDVWATLPKVVQEVWVLQWLDDQLVNDEVTPINPQDLPIPDSHRPLVMRYSGCFAEASGANCFSATLAMALGTLAKAERVIDVWLHQEPFLRALRAQGYYPVQEIHSGGEINVINHLDVLIWLSKDGRLVHASFCVAPGYVFNKMGQSWEQPWLVLRIEDVIDYDEVVSQGGKLMVYRKREEEISPWS